MGLMAGAVWVGVAEVEDFVVEVLRVDDLLVVTDEEVEVVGFEEVVERVLDLELDELVIFEEVESLDDEDDLELTVLELVAFVLEETDFVDDVDLTELEVDIFDEVELFTDPVLLAEVLLLVVPSTPPLAPPPEVPFLM